MDGRVRATILLWTGGAFMLLAGWPVAVSGQTGQWLNVEILTGVSVEDMDVFMRAMGASLGVGCDYCHAAGGREEETPRKETTRSMMRMIAALDGLGFEALDAPTCWTCHRGVPVPGAAPPPLVEIPSGPFSESAEPAGTVYRNVRQVAGIPADELRDVMAGFASSLGVGCDYCHTTGDWANDSQVTKLLSRRMMEIQAQANEAGLSSSELSCWTCHRGRAVPEINLPAELL